MHHNGSQEGLQCRRAGQLGLTINALLAPIRQSVSGTTPLILRTLFKTDFTTFARDLTLTMVPASSCSRQTRITKVADIIALLAHVAARGRITGTKVVLQVGLDGSQMVPMM